MSKILKQVCPQCGSGYMQKRPSAPDTDWVCAKCGEPVNFNSAQQSVRQIRGKMRKINVSFKIEVDVEAYANEYGITIDEAITRIKSHVRDAGTAELIENGFVKQAICLTKRVPDAANGPA